MNVRKWRVFDWFVWAIIAFAIGFLLAARPSVAQELYPTISVQPDGAALLAAQNLPGNAKVAVIGMSNTKQIGDPLVRKQGFENWTVAARGGQVASYWANKRDPRDGSNPWSNVPSNSKVFWVMVVDYARNQNTYEAQLEVDLNRIVQIIRQDYPGALVLMSGLHHEEFAPPNSKQPDWAAVASNNVTDRIVAQNSDVAWGPYLWNPAPQARSGDGFNITFAMAQGRGGVHLTSAGSQYVADRIDRDWCSQNAIGVILCGDGNGGPGPDPDPDPDPDPPPTGGMCEPDPQYPGQQCKTDFRPGFCTCKNPWRKTPL